MMDAHPDTYEGPERDEAVAERIREMTGAQLRTARDAYRERCRQLGGRPYGFRFGEWLRDALARRRLP